MPVWLHADYPVMALAGHNLQALSAAMNQTHGGLGAHSLILAHRDLRLYWRGRAPAHPGRVLAQGGVMEQKQRRQRPQAASPGEAVYGLGLIGALVWYWQQAQSPGERAVSVLKALVWPAFLVYDALKALHR